jgi:hypothetical protein
MNQKITIDFVKKQESMLLSQIANYDPEDGAMDGWADQVCESVEFYFQNCKLLNIEPNKNIGYI